MNDSPETLEDVKPRSRAEAFSAIISDDRISHGAFRLWHFIRDHVNTKTGEAFPGYHAIQSALHCSHDSIRPWINELVESGWLEFRVLKSKAHDKGCRFVYTLLDGAGGLFLKVGKVGVPESRNTPNRSQNQEQSVPESRNRVFLKSGLEVTPFRKGREKKNGRAVAKGGINTSGSSATLDGFAVADAQQPSARANDPWAEEAP